MLTKLLTTFVSANSRQDIHQFYATIGVKSHGTITCITKKKKTLF